VVVVVVDVLVVDVVVDVVDDVVVVVGFVVVVVGGVVVGHLAWRVIVMVSGPPLDVGKGLSLMLPEETEQLIELANLRSSVLCPAETVSTKTKALIPIPSATTSNLTHTLRAMAVSSFYHPN